MSSIAARTYLTPEEYIAAERKATLKSEYLSGEIVAMSGASNEHNLITMNTANGLYNQVTERGCRVYGSDMRVGISAGCLLLLSGCHGLSVINRALRMMCLIHSSIRKSLLKCFRIQPQTMTEARNSYAIGNWNHFKNTS